MVCFDFELFLFVVLVDDDVLIWVDFVCLVGLGGVVLFVGGF